MKMLAPLDFTFGQQYDRASCDAMLVSNADQLFRSLSYLEPRAYALVDHAKNKVLRWIFAPLPDSPFVGMPDDSLESLVEMLCLEDREDFVAAYHALGKHWKTDLNNTMHWHATLFSSIGCKKSGLTSCQIKILPLGTTNGGHIWLSAVSFAPLIVPLSQPFQIACNEEAPVQTLPKIEEKPPFGLSIKELHVLRVFALNDNIVYTELAERVGIPLSSIKYTAKIIKQKTQASSLKEALKHLLSVGYKWK